MKAFHRLVFALSFCLLAVSAIPSWAQFGGAPVFGGGPDEDAGHTKIELISENATVKPGESFTVGLRMKMDDGWKTYWKFGGDTDAPTTIAWTLPKHVKAGDIQWPAPKRFIQSSVGLVLVGFGYEKEVMLLTTMSLPASFDKKELKIKADVEWLECDAETCVPGGGSAELVIPVSKAASKPGKDAPAFAASRATIPTAAEGWKTGFVLEGEQVVLEFVPPAEFGEIEKPAFYPSVPDLLNLTSTGELARDDNGAFRLIFDKGEFAPEPVDFRKIKGILLDADGGKLPGGAKALELELPVGSVIPEKKDARSDAVESNSAGSATAAASSAEPAAGTAKGAAASANPKAPKGFLSIAFFLFLGGLILNLMPCVFPVLSLKIMSFVNHAKDTNTKPWHHGLVFAFGVLLSFWVMALAMIILKKSVPGINWGFQMQSPVFVALMAILFFVLGLNLLGVFEIGQSMSGVGGNLQHKSGFAGSFFSGVLAVLVATPCTAPFMGSALPVAFAKPAPVALALFTFLGLGMALPYVILSSSPGLMKRLPKPGEWMITFKQVVGIIMMFVVVWLLWVLGSLDWSEKMAVGADGLVKIFAAFVVIGTGAWIYGRWGEIGRKMPTRMVAGLLGLLCLGAGIAMAVKPPAEPSEQWVAWSPERVEAELAKGNSVFVDFTAKWCITCKANKLNVLTRPDIEDDFRKAGVVTMVADFTSRKNPDISNALEQFGVEGVPAYPLYTASGEAPKLLPNILTKGIVRDELNAL